MASWDGHPKDWPALDKCFIKWNSLQNICWCLFHSVQCVHLIMVYYTQFCTMLEMWEIYCRCSFSHNSMILLQSSNKQTNKFTVTEIRCKELRKRETKAFLLRFLKLVENFSQFHRIMLKDFKDVANAPRISCPKQRGKQEWLFSFIFWIGNANGLKILVFILDHQGALAVYNIWTCYITWIAT